MLEVNVGLSSVIAHMIKILRLYQCLRKLKSVDFIVFQGKLICSRWIMKQFRRERIEFVGIIIYKMAMKQT